MADPQASSPDLDAGTTIRVAAPRPTLSGQGKPDLLLPEELTALLPEGSYHVQGFIGAGGMGAVYKGVQVRLHRPVAIKVMNRDLGRDHDFAERFRREALAMAQLNHPNIVNVIDFGEAGADYLYIVMELVDGVDLMEIIRTGGMTQERAATLLPQICDALQFAHDHGIVHRDIKPGNIMLTRDGRVKMADFGLAKRYDAESTFQTQPGAGMGTPDYAAPEQFDPAAEIDHRADIYALGVMIYQMITGHVPRGSWLPPSRRAAVDVHWDSIVDRAMQSDPKDRYQMASEVKTDVSSIPLAAAQEAATARRPAAVTPKPPPAPGRNARSLVLLAAISFLMLGLVYWLAWVRPRSLSAVVAAPVVKPATAPAAITIPGLPDLPPLTLPPGEPGLVKEFEVAGAGPLKQMLVLPDSRRMLAFLGGNVSLIDLETTLPVWSQSIERGLFAASLSQDGSRFATYHLLGEDGKELASHAGATQALIRLHETATGKLIQSWKTPTSDEDTHYHFLALSLSGRSLVARVRPAGADASLFLRFEEGAAEPVQRWQAPATHFGYTLHAWTEDQYISIGGTGGLLLNSGGKVEALFPEQAQYYGAISADRNHLVATQSGTLGLWDLRERKLARTLDQSGPSLRSIAFAGSGLVVMGVPKKSAPDTTELQTWDASTGTLLTSLPLSRPEEDIETIAAADNGSFALLHSQPDSGPNTSAASRIQIYRLPTPQR